MEKNAKDSSFIATTNQSSSLEDVVTNDSNDISRINCENDEKFKIMALEFEIQMLKAEKREQQMLLQMFDEKECALKEEILDMKFLLQEGMKISLGPSLLSMIFSE